MKKLLKNYENRRNAFALGFCCFLMILVLPRIYAQNNESDGALFNDPPFWRQALGGSVTGHPSSQAESVVMICDGGNAKAYSWQGRPLWDYYARGRLTPHISRSPEGTSYICRTNGTLIAVNRAGRELWQINLGEVILSPVLIGWDGRLFVFTASSIRCFTASGFPLWSKTLDKKIGLLPAMDNTGGFYLVMEDGEFLRINAFGHVSSEQLEAVPVAIAPLKLGIDQRFSLLFFYPRGDMELLDTSDGSREKITGAPYPVFPLAATGYLSGAALLLRDGKLAYLSMEDRKIAWIGNTHIEGAEAASGRIESELLFDERGIYLLSRSGATAFSADGRRLWVIRIRGAASLPAFSDEGVLYSGGNDWILYAYRLEERVRSQKKVLYGPAPEGNYGTGLSRPELWTYHFFRYTEEELDKSFMEIRSAIRIGRIGEMETEYASRLIDIAGSGLNLPRIGAGPSQSPVFSRHRYEAARLLSYMGSRETVPFLTRLFTGDEDTLVKAGAAEALGRIGVDPEGLALNAFSQAVFPPVHLQDEHALSAVASATGAICRFSGPPLSEAGIRILTYLAGADKPATVRSQAERELRSLRR